jgi:glutathione synthase/RimK-type ligase-like ATP-grasp enzyme
LITASRKLRQIQVAAAAGLSIPETIVTNSGTDVVDFVKQYRRCIIKPLSAGSFVYEGKQWGLFTHQLKLTDLEALLDMVGYAPVMVQRELEKYQELRITIIGDKVFPCAIDTSTSDFQDVRTDWRVIAPEKIPHSLVTIPVSLSHALCSILAHYGLNYGAFDVIQEPDGRYYFLELNPNGQYLWIELLTGAPLSVAMVELIEGLAAVPAQGTFSNREPMGVSRCC